MFNKKTGWAFLILLMVVTVVASIVLGILLSKIYYETPAYIIHQNIYLMDDWSNETLTETIEGDIFYNRSIIAAFKYYNVSQRIEALPSNGGISRADLEYLNHILDKGGIENGTRYVFSR